MNPISLFALVGELQLINQDSRAYLNRITGETVILLNEYMESFGSLKEDDIDKQDDWQRDLLIERQRVLSSNDFLPLPDTYEIDEHHMMQSFCYTIDDYYIRDTLLGSIQKKGAFRRFNNAIDQFRLREDWYEFKNQAFKELTVDWLEEHDIPYQDDME